jgi:hypothetical protein
MMITAALKDRGPNAPGQNRPASVTVQSVQLDGCVEVPGSADFDHVVLAGQCSRECRVGFLAFHDAPDSFIDFRHATGENEGH